MKQSLLLICIFMLVMLSVNKLTISQDTDIVKYLPLKTGNVWVYHTMYQSNGGGYSSYDKVLITGTTNHNGKTYYTNQIYSTYNGPICGFWLFGHAPVRVDSLNGNILEDTSCALVDSLKSRLHDSSKSCFASNYKTLCSDTGNFSIFGNSYPARTFWTSMFTQVYRKYAKYIGFVRYDAQNYQSNCSSILRGCVIDGVVYGDTSFPVGINQISTEVPKSFWLWQNYPNPFNPTTKISFDIPPVSFGEGNTPEARRVRLSIYNTLGQEIDVPVNEQLRPGTYEVEWNAADLPSGVYLYMLQYGDYSDSKKMVLIK